MTKWDRREQIGSRNGDKRRGKRRLAITTVIYCINFCRRTNVKKIAIKKVAENENELF